MFVEIFGPDTHDRHAAQMAGQEHVEFRNTARPRVEVVAGDTVDHRASVSGLQAWRLEGSRISGSGYCTARLHPSVH